MALIHRIYSPQWYKQMSGIQMQETSSPKVFVLALDGATFDLIQPWVDAGKLPIFAKFMQSSAWGKIESTIPPITPVAWLTFATSKNPGKHGVYNFFRPVREDHTQIIPIAASINTELTIWELLSQRGKQVCVLNVPMTFPPKAVNGSLYAGLPMPISDLIYSHPPELHEELLEHGWDLRRNADFSHGSYEEFFDYLLDLVRVRTEATLYLMQNRAWDFFMVHYLETDSVAHTYWRFWEYESSEHPMHDAMLKLFQTIEEQMQRIFDALPDDATLLVVSDHGVGAVHYHLHLNNWLLQEGFLHWKNNFSTRLRRLTYQLGFHPTNLYRRIPERLLKRLTFGQMRAEFAGIQRQVHTVDGKSAQVKRWLTILMRTPFLYLSDIDWSTSQAYSSGTTQAGLIYINLAGREPNAPVQPGADYEAVREAIRERLYRWINPFTGEKMVDRVCFREELYQGHQIEDAPDLIVLYKDEDYEDRKGAVFLSSNPIEPVKNAVATHRLMGMLMINSPAVQIGPIQSHLTLADMAPLIFYLLDEPIPTEFEGRLPTELLKPTLIANRPPQTIATLTSVTTPRAEELSAADQEKVLEQLRRLGYLA